MKSYHNYFQKRIDELTGLHDKAGSKTSTALIQDAILLTQKANAENMRVHSISENSLKRYDGILDQFNDGRAKLTFANEHIRSMTNADLYSEDTKNKIIVAANAMQADIENAYEKRRYANRSVRDAIAFCDEQLSEVLQTMIFKPNAASFQIDSVIAILKKIVVGWIPYSDKAEIILEASISKRKKDYLSGGDKILIYLEDYVSVLQTWLTLNEQFEREVLD